MCRRTELVGPTVGLPTPFYTVIPRNRPIYSPVTSRWGYGGRILDLNPRRPHGGWDRSKTVLQTDKGFKQIRGVNRLNLNSHLDAVMWRWINTTEPDLFAAFTRDIASRFPVNADLPPDLFACYVTLGIRRPYSRLKPQASSWGWDRSKTVLQTDKGC